MTYFPDLTPYTYALTNDNVDASVLNVGWLDISAPYAVGVTSQEFQKKLLDFCVSEYIVLRCLVIMSVNIASIHLGPSLFSIRVAGKLNLAMGKSESLANQRSTQHLRWFIIM
jgi:hypothetical protein